MALTLYRRHLAACIVRKSKISARAKRLAMDCDLWVIKTQFVTAFGGTAERWVLSTGEVGWT